MRFVLLLPAFAAVLYAQVELGQLYSAGEYAEVVAATNNGERDSDALFLRGMSLARLDRWTESEQALRLGQALSPHDPRFPTELAGVSYRLEDYRRARKHLRRALDLAPDDEYVRNFLGSLHLLDSNMEAALAQWNRIDQPLISAVEMPPNLQTDAVLLDRALTFAPTTTLQLSEIRTSRARLDLLNAFSSYDFDLAPELSGDGYKLRLRGSERRGFFNSPWFALARSARGLPYQTVFLEHDNGGGKASSLHALARWDPNRRRANVSYSRPLAGEARYRLRFFADARDEHWRLAPYPDAALGDFQLQKIEAGAGFDSVVNGSLRWGGEAAAIVRSFRGEGTNSPRTPDAAGARTALLVHWTPLRFPARRIIVSTDSRLSLASIADDQGTLYGCTESSAQLAWTSGRNWNFSTRFSGGALFGTAPFDELYIFGIDRDEALAFRGFRSADRGRKGSAPTGDRFWLSSTDLTRRVAQISLLDVHAGPYFDAGAVSDSRREYGSSGVQLSAGIQLELRLFGAFGIKLLYGRDLRTDQDLFFTRPYPDRDLLR